MGTLSLFSEIPFQEVLTEDSRDLLRKVQNSLSSSKVEALWGELAPARDGGGKKPKPAG